MDEVRKRKWIAYGCGLAAVVLAALFFLVQGRNIAHVRADYERRLATMRAGAADEADSVSPLDALPVGMSAVTVSTDAVHALGGQLTRGMRVTLMGVLPDGRVEALARDVAVLAADAGLDEDVAGSSEGEASGGRASLLNGGAADGSTDKSARRGANISWVTLALPDDHVTRILAAANANTLHLVLPKWIADEDLGDDEGGLGGEDPLEPDGNGGSNRSGEASAAAGTAGARGTAGDVTKAGEGQ